MEPSFYYAIPWRDAAAIHRELDERYIPHMLESLPTGEVAIVFPDLPPQFYAVVRQICGGNGIPTEN